MTTTKLINPDILAALAYCGHGSKVLIADANYPLAEKSGNARKVYLGLTRGLPTVTDVLEAILSVVNVEKAEVMVPEEGPEPEIFEEFRSHTSSWPLLPESGNHTEEFVSHTSKVRYLPDPTVFCCFSRVV